LDVPPPLVRSPA
jgi:hypothetical protein